ncbi:MAG TPA: PDZ domain-containing protein [Acidobacteriota bacterium]
MDKFKRLNGTVKAAGIVALTLVLTGALVLLAAEKAATENARHGFLGVSVQRLDDGEREKIGVSHGVQVMDVEKESAADQAGIQEGDVIQAVNGEKVRDPQALAEIVRESAAGSTVKIGIWRGGKALEIKAVLGQLGPRRNFIWQGAPLTKIVRSRAFIGVNLLEPDAHLAAYFAVPAGQGVLITAVEKGTPAEKAGLKSGDVIVQMAGKAVKESDDIHEALAALKEGDVLEIMIVRHGKRETLKAEPDFSRHERIMRFFGGGKDIEIDHLELPEMDIEIPDFEGEAPEPPDAQVIESHVHQALDHAQEKLDLAHEKLGQAKIKIEKRLKHSSGKFWI